MEAAKLFSTGSYKMEKFRFSLKGNLAKEIAFYHVVFICNKKNYSMLFAKNFKMFYL
jgi:hypothetical protein